MRHFILTAMVVIMSLGLMSTQPVKTDTLRVMPIPPSNVDEQLQKMDNINRQMDAIEKRFKTTEINGEHLSDELENKRTLRKLKREIRREKRRQ